jgi:hypothetical protein
MDAREIEFDLHPKRGRSADIIIYVRMYKIFLQDKCGHPKANPLQSPEFARKCRQSIQLQEDPKKATAY